MKKLYSPSKSLLSLFLLLVTFTVHSADYFWIGGSGTWSDLSHWSTTSGGSTLHSSLPGETDNVIFDANSFSADGQTVTVDGNIIRVNDFIATNVSYNINFSGTAPVPDIEIYGSMDAPANISFELPSVLLDFNSNVDGQSVNIASGLLNTSEDASVRFSGEGSWSIENGLSGHSLFVTQGEIIFGANTFNFKNVYLWYSFDKTLNLTDATLNIEKWTMNNAEFVTVIPTNSTINFSDEFQGFGKTYGTVNVTTPTGFGDDIVISGNNTFQNFTVVQGANLLVDANTTQTILGNLTFNGTSSEVITFESSIDGEKFNFDGTGINISGEYVNISDADFLGTASFSLENSLLIGDVTGWENSSVPTPTGNGQFYYSRIFSDSVFVGLTAGEGQERIVFMREGTFPDVTVADDTEYTSNTTFGQGDLVGTDTYVVYQGNENQIKIEGLQPNTDYYITRMEVNSTADKSSIKYQSTSTSFSKSTTTLESGNIYMQNGSTSVNTGDRFYDDGGAGFYFPNRSQVLTLNSAEAGKSVKLTFNELELRSYEELKIFDGADTTAAVLEVFSGSNHTLPLNVTSSGESLTVKFESGDFETSGFSSDGWQADLEVLLVEPSIKPSNFSITDVQDSQISFEFTPGNGAKRLILAAEEGTGINYNATDNVSYTANSTFGSGEEFSPGVFVVGNGDISQLTLTGLSANTTYNIRISEYNEAGSSINYATASQSLSTSISNKVLAPDDDFFGYRINPQIRFQIGSRMPSALELFAVGVSPNSARNENDFGLLVLASKNEVTEEELSNVLVDDFRINSSTVYGSGDEIMPGVFALSKDKFLSPFSVTGLNPETQYFFYAVMFRENTDGVRYGVSTFKEFARESTIKENAILLGDGQNTVSEQRPIYDFTGRSGRLVGEFNYVETYYPAQSGEVLKLNLDYLENSNDISFIVYDGEDTSAAVLKDNTPFSTYNVKSEVLTASNPAGALTIKYSKAASQTYYGEDDGFSGTILPYKEGAKPTKLASNIRFSNLTHKSVQLDWESGNGDKTLVILTSGNSEAFVPENGFDYEVSNDLSNEISAGNYVVYNGTGNTVSLNNLSFGTDYQVRIYEYNETSNDLTYSEAAQSVFGTKAITPEVEASDIDFEIIDEQSVKLNWKKGDGQKRLVFFGTSNGINFNNELLGSYSFEDIDGGHQQDLPSYQDLSRRNIVLAYNGSGESVTITGLQEGRSYFFKVIEYNRLNDDFGYLIPRLNEQFSLTPTLPSYTFDFLDIYDEGAVSVGLDANSLDALVVLSKSENTEVPFTSGRIPEALKESNYYTSEDGYIYLYEGFFEDKIVRIQNLDSINVNSLRPNTTYHVEIYPIAYNDVALNFDTSNTLKGNFTTDSVQNFYYVDSTGNWNDVENWVTSSGGDVLHNSLPDENSHVIIDENSFRQETEDPKYIYCADSEYSLYSLDISQLDQNVTIVNENYYGLDLTIGSSMNTNEYAKIVGGQYVFLQLADSNYININERTVHSLEFEENIGNRSFVKDLPYAYRLRANGSNIVFDSSFGDLEVYRLETSKTSVTNLPTVTEVGQINSSLHFPKIESDDGDEFLLRSSLIVDSLVFSSNSLKFTKNDTLTVSFFKNSGKSLSISTEMGISYIRSDQDSLIIEDAIIRDNHAIGDAIYLAENSVKLENVEGWKFGEKNTSSFETNASLFARKVLKNTLTVINQNPPKFKYQYITIKTAEDSISMPVRSHVPTVNSRYDSTLGFEQGIYVGSAEKFSVEGLEPATQYELRVYDFYQRNDSIYYSDPKQFPFVTLEEKAIVMGSEQRQELVTRNFMYSENGRGSSYPWNENIITLLPTSQDKVVGITAKPGTSLNSPLTLNIYDGLDNSANLIFSESMRNYEEIRNTIEVKSYIATNESGALTVELKKPEGGFGGSIYDRPTQFMVYESKGAVAIEPSVQVSNLQASNETKTTATLSWTKGDGDKTLILLSEGGTGYRSSTFKDGVEWNANKTFRLGDEIGEYPVKYAVYAGEGNSVDIDSLKPNTYYGALALSYNVSETEDANYLGTDLVLTSFYTTPPAPDQLPYNFTTFDREQTATNFSFQDSTGAGALIIIKENDAVDLSLVTDSIKMGNTSNYLYDFAELDTLKDGSRIYLNDGYSDMNYYLEGLEESTDYHYAIYNYRENSGGKSVNENALVGSFKTRDGSYRINDFSLPNQSLDNNEICVGAEIKIYYSYLGISEGGNSAIPVISQHLDLRDSTVLDVVSEDDGFMIVSIPEALDSGIHYFSMIPELGSDFSIYKDSLNIQPIQEIEITRTEDKLAVNANGNLNWFKNNELIQQESDSILQITSEGTYYASKKAANCEYFSNEIYVKARVALTQDTVQTCSNQLAEINFENAFGSLNDSFNYYAVLLDNSGNEQNLELDSINLSDNYFNFFLPEDLPTAYYAVTLKAEGDSIASDTASLYVEKLEPAVITLTENGLTSNYESGNQWLLDGEPINGATSQTIGIERSGVYSVEVSTEFCTIQSEGVTLTSNRKGLSAVGFRAYPNPVRNDLSLKYTGDEYLGLSSVVVTDLTGKTVYNGLHDFQSDNRLEIPLNEISSGVYFITVETKNFRAQQKLIKK